MGFDKFHATIQPINKSTNEQMNNKYDTIAFSEMRIWQQRMQRPPSFHGRMAKNIQTKINKAIPEKVHTAITTAIKQMMKAVITSADFINPAPSMFNSLEELETQVKSRINFYKKTAAAEGALTGAGGFVWGLADFPLWLTIKMKLLFEIAALYGHDTSDIRERVYIMSIFQLTFSSQKHRNKIYQHLENWDEYSKEFTSDINQLDWRSFQQEYRDYIDLAKLVQLIPGIGAVVGAYVNHRLTEELGATAMNAYRMRLNASH